ncbi:hypothetical protein RvY_06510 [Ramazzottius varieornatus]|uniref:Uncharacterized protein n=1 Tax=Ramazzottius varieornatus TaxID=947166 RepID=A0A1D1V8F8_RAMVA|nr:hypothetical protein RvY_06510 [Ramazzottius varieornatus]
MAYPIVCYKSFFTDRKPRVLLQGPSGQADSNAVSAVKTNTTSVRALGVNGKPGGFLISTLMTLNVAICLLPKETYYTIMMLTDVELPLFYAVAERLGPIVDPILIVLGNTELRRMAFGRICRHCK